MSKDSSRLIKELPEGQLCQLCQRLQSKYTCPRCNILYCSIACYRSESHAHCSETFYKECIQEELKSMNTSRTAQERMNQALQGTLGNQASNETEDDLDFLQDEDDGEDSDEEDDPDPDADPSELWKSLTAEERKDFKQMLISGRILDVVPQEPPWWLSGEDLPELTPDIPDITTLLVSRPVAPIIPYLIMNAVMAYQVTMHSLKSEKFFNVEAATGMYHLSSAFRGDYSEVRSLDEAVKLLMKDLSQCQWATQFSEESIKDNLRDLTLIRFDYLLLALSDMKDIFDTSLTVQDPAVRGRFTGEPPKAKILKIISKKISFYQAYIKSLDSDRWAHFLDTQPG